MIKNKKEKDLKKLGIEFESLKEKLKSQLHSETLKKYTILSRAYKIGKLLHGKKFSTKILSKEFEIPYTTTKRLLSLDRMTPVTKRLLHEGKITAYKVAQICSTKNKFFQDEIIKLVIDKELSTYDITKLKMKSLEDLKKYRLNKSITSGFAKKDTAYRSFNNIVNRFEMLLESDISLYPTIKYGEVKTSLIKIKHKIDDFLERNK